MPHVALRTIVRRIARDTEYSDRAVLLIAAHLIDEIKLEMIKGNRVYIRRFGFLYLLRGTRIMKCGKDSDGSPHHREVHIAAPRFQAVRTFRNFIRSQLFPTQRNATRDYSTPKDLPKTRRGLYERQRKLDRRAERKAIKDARATDVQRP